MRLRSLGAMSVAVVAVVLALPAPVALADHTDPREPLAPTQGVTGGGVARGEGTWQHMAHFPANPGTDLEFWTKEGRTFSSSGTLGQGDAGHVGQRILQLVNSAGQVTPRWVADHGSAHCTTANPSGTTGLQHDVQATPRSNVQLLVDTTDATGRCHDAPGGGIELVDVSGLPNARFNPREIHLTRHDGTSHNATVDATRPWIVYNSNTDTGRPWIDVIDIRSCLGLEGLTLAQKRARCRPRVHRMPFRGAWTTQRDYDPTEPPEDGRLEDPDDPSGGATGCHDITAEPGRLYCAAINGTAVFDVSALTTSSGAVKGTPLPCTPADGMRTKAKVTNCDLFVPGEGSDGNDPATEDREAYAALGSPRAEGWRFLGSVNHAGREDGNTNQFRRADEDVAVSHEADKVPGRNFMFVTDERGGGVVPPGASCAPGLDNPIGNGGMHVYDISNLDPSRDPPYARTPTGEKAIFISDQVTAGATFCNIHVIENIPGEQRVVMAWYSQGVKIVDYFINANGRWTFDEVASFQFPNSNTWTVEDFKIVNHANGTRSYFFLASDIQRGIDVLRWTGPTNRNGERVAVVAARAASSRNRGNLGLLVAGLVVLPVAAVIGRRRRMA